MLIHENSGWPPAKALSPANLDVISERRKALLSNHLAESWLYINGIHSPCTHHFQLGAFSRVENGIKETYITAPIFSWYGFPSSYFVSYKVDSCIATDRVQYLYPKRLYTYYSSGYFDQDRLIITDRPDSVWYLWNLVGRSPHSHRWWITSALMENESPLEIMADIGHLSEVTVFVILGDGPLKNDVEARLKHLKRPYHSFHPPKMGWCELLERTPKLTFEDFCLTDPTLLLQRPLQLSTE